MKIEFDFTGISDADREILIKDFNSKIHYITSGARDSYERYKVLESNLSTWSRAFVKELLSVGIKHYHTNYSSFECGNSWFEVDVPYTLDHSSFKNEGEFHVKVYNKRLGEIQKIGECKDVHEVIGLLVINKLIEPDAQNGVKK